MTPRLQQIINSEEMNKYLSKLKRYHLPTYEHSLRVGAYVERVSSHLKEKDIPIDDLIKGALLHDIGKCNIPLPILAKEGDLSAKEWNILKQHPYLGYQMIKDDFNEHITNGVYYHHEKFDGTGYPCRLSIEIPREAAIIAICDIYDAMTTDREYRPAMTHEATMEYLYADAKNYKLDSSIIDILAGHHSIETK